MKLLLDQHLSHRLLRQLNAAFPDSKHVKDFNMTNADDEILWRFASENNFVIVSKDSDFFNRSVVRGHPPKIKFLRLGNCPSSKILDTLLSNQSAIHDFVNSSIESLLVLQE